MKKHIFLCGFLDEFLNDTIRCDDCFNELKLAFLHTANDVSLDVQVFLLDKMDFNSAETLFLKGHNNEENFFLIFSKDIVHAKMFLGSVHAFQKNFKHFSNFSFYILNTLKIDPRCLAYAFEAYLSSVNIFYRFSLLPKNTTFFHTFFEILSISLLEGINFNVLRKPLDVFADCLRLCWTIKHFTETFELCRSSRLELAEFVSMRFSYIQTILHMCERKEKDYDLISFLKENLYFVKNLLVECIKALPYNRSNRDFYPFSAFFLPHSLSVLTKKTAHAQEKYLKDLQTKREQEEREAIAREKQKQSSVFLSYSSKKEKSAKEYIAGFLETQRSAFDCDDSDLEEDLEYSCLDPEDNSYMFKQTKPRQPSFSGTLKYDSSKSEDAPQATLSEVQFSAVSAKKMIKNELSEIDVYMYEDAYRAVIDEALKGAETKETKSGVFKIQARTKVKIVLSSPQAEIYDDEEELEWFGKYQKFSFAVLIPETFKGKTVLFTAKIYFNGVLATRLNIITDCVDGSLSVLETQRKDITSAFISYASPDRDTVTMIVQGLKTARPDMKIFFDVESLRSGQQWKEQLDKHIDASDVLYLCWSSHARASEWVNYEWRHAYDSKGLDAIEPIPLEDPRNCPPPAELNSKHFNDLMLYIRK